MRQHGGVALGEWWLDRCWRRRGNRRHGSIEIGYFFHPAAWGRGYATELTAACMSLADNVLRVPDVRAVAHPENVGSRRVLEKAAFDAVRFVPEMERFLYRRRRQG